FILMYSISDPASFAEIEKLHSKLLSYNGDNRPVILVSNKIELATTGYYEPPLIPSSRGRELAASLKCKLFLECSVKDDVNVGECFKDLVREVRRQEGIIDEDAIEPPTPTKWVKESVDVDVDVDVELDDSFEEATVHHVSRDYLLAISGSFEGVSGDAVSVTREGDGLVWKEEGGGLAAWGPVGAPSTDLAEFPLSATMWNGVRALQGGHGCPYEGIFKVIMTNPTEHNYKVIAIERPDGARYERVKRVSPGKGGCCALQ
ncbi:hypothetical protein TeGR_g11319, partial [Tetraparma gracilis]